MASQLGSGGNAKKCKPYELIRVRMGRKKLRKEKGTPWRGNHEGTEIACGLGTP